MDNESRAKPFILGQTLGSPLGKSCQFVFLKKWFSTKSPLLKFFFQGVWRSCRIVSRIFCLTFSTPPFLPQANCSRAFFPDTNFSFHSMPLEYTKLFLFLHHCPETSTSGPPQVLSPNEILFNPQGWTEALFSQGNFTTTQPTVLPPSENSQCLLLSG